MIKAAENAWDSAISPYGAASLSRGEAARPQGELGRVLIVDDDASVAALLSSCLEFEGFEVVVAENLATMEQRLRDYHFDAVLLDIYLKDENGLDGMPFVLRESPRTKVLIITAAGSIELAVNAMQRGASGFITKTGDPFSLVGELKAHLANGSGPGTSEDLVTTEEVGLVGRSPALLQVIDEIQRMKNVDSTVLICGESGTGKELVAKALHRLSRRNQERFEAINCGAIPENLLESELFGHRKGAFTDAKIDRKGLFEVCSDGSLLLDEIGEMPLSLQVKLLRVLQEREVRPIGATNSTRINTRVIASTNRSLEEEVRKGAFREDLFFRLSVLRIELPALRERREDIPVLVEHFIEKFNQRFGKAVMRPCATVMARLTAYEWPGNIRELRNAIERGVVLSRDNRLHVEDLFFRPKAADKARPDDTYGAVHAGGTLPLTKAKQSFEKAYLMRVLDVARGNISEAARISGQYRANLYRLLEKYKIDPATFK